METVPAVNQFDAARTASAASAVIRVEDAHKYYELGETRVHALRGVAIEIRRGEFVAIMGASGSGKSTFMNILSFMLRGDVLVRNSKQSPPQTGRGSPGLAENRVEPRPRPTKLKRRK